MLSIRSVRPDRGGLAAIRRGCAGLALGALFLAAQGPEELQIVRVGLHDAKPVTFRNADGVPSGFLVEVFEEIATREGWQLDFRHGSWAECLERLQSGEIDLLFPILPTADRARIFDFSEETMFSTFGRVFRRSGSEIESMLDLHGKRIAVVAGDHFEAAIREEVRNFDQVCDFHALKTKTAALQCVVDGHCDAVAIEGLAGFAYVRERDLEPTAIVFAPAIPHVATRKGDGAALLAAVDRQLKQLKADHESVYYRAYEKWVYAIETRAIPAWVMWAIAGSVWLLTVLATVSLVLRRKINTKTRELLARNNELQREIANRTRAEEALLHSQKMEAVGQLASGVAHDFRNILMVISAHVERVRQEVSTSQRALDSLARMEEAVGQASTMTRSLLTFSRKLPVRKKPVNLCTIVEETARMVQRALPARIELVVEAADEPSIWIHADDAQIQQVILNLALNARDAMHGEGKLSITLTRVDAGGEAGARAYLTVEDTGLGMPPEMQARIFEPFFTTKTEEGGTGLGLATVRSILDDHEGRIELRSTVGAGTVFTVDFPCLESAAPPEAELAASAPDGAGETVLLAEDHPQVRQVVAAALVSFGYEVVQARSGRELLGRLAEEGKSVRMLVVDVDLPDGSGFDVVRGLREDGNQIPAILMTGTFQAELNRKLDSSTALLLKPFRMAQLGDLVRQLLRAEAGAARQ